MSTKKEISGHSGRLSPSKSGTKRNIQNGHSPSVRIILALCAKETPAVLGETINTILRKNFVFVLRETLIPCYLDGLSNRPVTS